MHTILLSICYYNLIDCDFFLPISSCLFLFLLYCGTIIGILVIGFSFVFWFLLCLEISFYSVVYLKLECLDVNRNGKRHVSLRINMYKSFDVDFLCSRLNSKWAKSAASFALMTVFTSLLLLLLLLNLIIYSGPVQSVADFWFLQNVFNQRNILLYTLP